MKLLPVELGIEGRTLRQLERSATAAIYELIGSQGFLYGYEVVKIAIRKESEQFGTVFPEREIYPCSSQFGKMGWSYGSVNREQAFERFDRLVQSEGVTVPVYHPSALARSLEGEVMACC
jgi:hypothetical protein